MIETILTNINYREIASNRYYYAFEYNFKTYLVYRRNSIRVFSVDEFREISPEEIITNVWVDNPRDFLEENESPTKLFRKLQDVTLPIILGGYYEAINVKKAKAESEDIDDYVIEELSKQQLLSRRFFITNKGLAIFTFKEENEKERIPDGIIFFSKYNVKHLGYPNLKIFRANDREGEKLYKGSDRNTLLIFNPTTIVDVITTTKYSDYNSNIFISQDIQKTELYKISENSDNILLQIRPTKFELEQTLYFYQKLFQSKGIYFKIHESLENFHLYLAVQNYSKEKFNYGKYEKEYPNQFVTYLFDKNVQIKDSRYDIMEFCFAKTPAVMKIVVETVIKELVYEINGVEYTTFIHYTKEFKENLLEFLPSMEFLQNSQERMASHLVNDSPQIIDDEYDY